MDPRRSPRTAGNLRDFRPQPPSPPAQLRTGCDASPGPRGGAAPPRRPSGGGRAGHSRVWGHWSGDGGGEDDSGGGGVGARDGRGEYREAVQGGPLPPLPRPAGFRLPALGEPSRAAEPTWRRVGAGLPRCLGRGGRRDAELRAGPRPCPGLPGPERPRGAAGPGVGGWRGGSDPAAPPPGPRPSQLARWPFSWTESSCRRPRMTLCTGFGRSWSASRCRSSCPSEYNRVGCSGGPAWLRSCFAALQD